MIVWSFLGIPSIILDHPRPCQGGSRNSFRACLTELNLFGFVLCSQFVNIFLWAPWTAFDISPSTSFDKYTKKRWAIHTKGLARIWGPFPRRKFMISLAVRPLGDHVFTWTFVSQKGSMKRLRQSVYRFLRKKIFFSAGILWSACRRKSMMPFPRRRQQNSRHAAYSNFTITWKSRDLFFSPCRNFWRNSISHVRAGSIYTDRLKRFFENISQNSKIGRASCRERVYRFV